jgi:hypothetical protein
MQQVSTAIPFFQNPPAMLAVSVVIAVVLCIIALHTKGMKYNMIIRALCWLFCIIAMLMVLWLILFVLYN